MQLLVPCPYLRAGPHYARPLAGSREPSCRRSSPMFIVLQLLSRWFVERRLFPGLLLLLCGWPLSFSSRPRQLSFQRHCFGTAPAFSFALLHYSFPLSQAHLKESNCSHLQGPWHAVPAPPAPAPSPWYQPGRFVLAWYGRFQGFPCAALARLSPQHPSCLSRFLHKHLMWGTS